MNTKIPCRVCESLALVAIPSLVNPIRVLKIFPLRSMLLLSCHVHVCLPFTFIPIYHIHVTVILSCTRMSSLHIHTHISSLPCEFHALPILLFLI
jgi:hypothetical protein